MNQPSIVNFNTTLQTIVLSAKIIQQGNWLLKKTKTGRLLLKNEI